MLANEDGMSSDPDITVTGEDAEEVETEVFSSYRDSICSLLTHKYIELWVRCSEWRYKSKAVSRHFP